MIIKKVNLFHVYRSVIRLAIDSSIASSTATFRPIRSPEPVEMRGSDNLVFNHTNVDASISTEQSNHVSIPTNFPIEVSVFRESGELPRLVEEKRCPKHL